MSRTAITDVNTDIESMEKWLPTQDHILIREFERTRSKIGLIIPGGEVTECCYGEVMALGKGEMNLVTGEYYPIRLSVGDIVICMKYAGGIIALRDGNYRLVREHGIWCKVLIDGPREKFTVRELIPYADRVVIDPKNDGMSQKGLIHLPKNPPFAYNTAHVIAVGLGKRDLKTGALHPIQVKRGDEVVFQRYQGCDVPVGNVVRRVVQAHDIVSLLER